MRIRSTENDHIFQSELYDRINAYSLQGLLMDSSHNFTAAIEAIEYDNDEIIRIPFNNNQLRAKFLLASKLKIPFFIIAYKECRFYILQVQLDSDGIFEFINTQNDYLNEEQFAHWWGNFKGTIQNKPLANGAGPRADNTVFDRVLENYGLKWGGNIDGFVVTDDFDNIICIIDNISVSRSLNDRYANPALYFNDGNPKHGPKYEGWLSTSLLAKTLQVPQALFTFNKKDDQLEQIGLTFISDLSRQRIGFVNDISPNLNVITGMDEIVLKFKNDLQAMHSPTVKVE